MCGYLCCYLLSHENTSCKQRFLKTTTTNKPVHFVSISLMERTTPSRNCTLLFTHGGGRPVYRARPLSDVTLYSESVREVKMNKE